MSLRKYQIITLITNNHAHPCHACLGFGLTNSKSFVQIVVVFFLQLVIDKCVSWVLALQCVAFGGVQLFVNSYLQSLLIWWMLKTGYILYIWGLCSVGRLSPRSSNILMQCCVSIYIPGEVRSHEQAAVAQSWRLSAQGLRAWNDSCKVWLHVKET